MSKRSFRDALLALALAASPVASIVGCRDDKARPAAIGDAGAGAMARDAAAVVLPSADAAPPPPARLDDAEIGRRVDAAFAVYEALARDAATAGADCTATAAALTRTLDAGAAALTARRALDGDRDDAARADAAVGARHERFTAIARAIDAVAQRCPGDAAVQRALDRLD